MLQRRHNFLRNVLFTASIEGKSALGVLVREEERSVILLDDVASAAPGKVEIDAAKSGVLG